MVPSATWMFSCVRVEQIWIPQEITSIGEGAFAYCYIFDGLTCNHTTPPTLGTDAFLDAGSETSVGKLRYIKVIKGAAAAFKAADGWKDYDDRISEWNP